MVWEIAAYLVDSENVGKGDVWPNFVPNVVDFETSLRVQIFCPSLGLLLNDATLHHTKTHTAKETYGSINNDIKPENIVYSCAQNKEEKHHKIPYSKCCIKATVHFVFLPK